VAGLLKTDGGAISLDDVALSRMAPDVLARRRGFLPQNPRCEWPISVERVVALGLTPILPAFGGWSAADQARIDKALENFDLTERRNQAATTLSGGELVRAMLARAFVGDPDILIVDEPITGLDPRHALDSMRRLQAFARAGKLVIASFHDLTLAGRFASRIVALRNGRIMRDGTPADVLTAASIQELFDVSSQVTTGAGGLYIDFTSQS
jgi:iron complex transport system ATP-binding protein